MGQVWPVAIGTLTHTTESTQHGVTHHAATLRGKYVMTQLEVTCRTLTHKALLNTSALPLRCGLYIAPPAFGNGMYAGAGLYRVR